MNNTLHSPGPWQLQTVSTCNDNPCRWEIIGSGGIIAETNDNTSEHARLISAAPDLLSALESAYNAIAWDIPSGNLSDEEVENLLDVIREALRKAKGEA